MLRGVRGHLFVETVQLSPSGEWVDASASWGFVRLSRGAAYCLSTSLTREVNVGEVVVAAPGVKLTIRASQLGEVTLHVFQFIPAFVGGFLTLAERHFLDAVAPKLKPPIEIIPADRLLATQFATLVESLPSGQHLFARCRALDLVASYFDEDLQRQPRVTAPATHALKRFDQVIEQMSDLEIMNYTPRQLAELCGCSVPMSPACSATTSMFRFGPSKSSCACSRPGNCRPRPTTRSSILPLTAGSAIWASSTPFSNARWA